MAGVVRRDGLREAVTKLRDEWAADEGRTWISNCGDELSCVLDAVPDDQLSPDEIRKRVASFRRACDLIAKATGKDDFAYVADELTLILDAVPDVPPATPLADHIKAGMLRGRVRLSDVPPDPPAEHEVDAVDLRKWLAGETARALPHLNGFEVADALLPYVLERLSLEYAEGFSSGVLVDAADVRARARTETLRELADFFMARDGLGYVVDEICRRIEGDRAVSEREGASE